MASRFGLPTADKDDLDFGDLVRGAVRVGSTGNGVFAARIMWRTMHVLVGGLGRRLDDRRNVDVLEGALGPLRFVHLRRLDVTSAAVSWAGRGSPLRQWSRSRLPMSPLVSDPGAATT